MPTGLTPDTRITFGSETENLEEDDYYDEDENAYRKKRDELIQKALDQQDKAFKEERRREIWGEFADAKTADDVEKVKKNLKETIDRENKFKAELAKQQGVDMEVLEAPDSDGGFFDDDGNMNIRQFTGRSWHANLDEDLKQEWVAMGGGVSATSQNGDEDIDEEVEPSVTDDTAAIDGKIVSREALKGVRVGSAGGWDLEVFSR